MKAKKIVIQNNKKQKLVGHYYKNNTGSLFIYCHGAKNFDLSKHPIFEEFFYSYYSLGFSFFWFDFTGYGESEGKKEISHKQRVSDIGNILDYFKNKYKKIILAGVSLGAIDAIIACLQYKQVTKLYLINGLYELRGLRPKFLIRFGLVALFNKKIREDIRYCRNNFKPEDISVPTLIVVGEKDQVVNPNQSLKLYKRLRTDKKIISIPDGNHALSKKKYIDMYMGEIGQWLTT